MEVSSIKTVPLEPTVQNEPKMKRTYPKIEILSENEIPNDLDDIATFIINGEKLRIIRAG